MITFTKLSQYGQWGNQLFQYTGTRLYAQLNNFKCGFPSWIGDKLFIDAKPYGLGGKIIAFFLPTYKISINEPEKLKALYEDPKDNINISGYLQDEFSLSLLEKHKNLVLKWLKLKDKIEQKFKKITNRYKPWVGIHVRRGDFPKEKWMPVRQYKLFLKKIAKNKNICIATDDKNVIRQFREFRLVKLENIFPDFPDYIFDFLVLKNAQMIVGSGSTFAWWAAYLGNKNNYYSPPLSHLWKNAKEVSFKKIHI